MGAAQELNIIYIISLADLFVVRMTYPLFGSPVPLLAATMIQRFL